MALQEAERLLNRNLALRLNRESNSLHDVTRGDMGMRKALYVVVAALLMAGALTVYAQNPPQREIVITIDDLPAGNANAMTGQEILEMTTKLLGTLQEQKVPAVGFVNEKKLYKFGEVDNRIKALSLWVESGFELGNHTFSHASLNRRLA